MAATETLVNELKINYLTEEQYQTALTNNQINENEIYMTPTLSDTAKVTQNAVVTNNVDYPVILAYDSNTAKVTNTVNKANSLKYNPSTGILSTNNIVLVSSYGDTLPSSGIEGQLFFLILD